jgi:hypothetical protein
VRAHEPIEDGFLWRPTFVGGGRGARRSLHGRRRNSGAMPVARKSFRAVDVSEGAPRVRLTDRVCIPDGNDVR